MPKRGRPSLEEIQYIKDKASTMTPEDIAEALDRTPEAIKDIIDRYIGARDDDTSNKVEARKELRESAEWKELRKQFAPDEMSYFEDRWATWMAQFKEDMLASEETQVFMLLKNEILINRNLAEKRLAEVDQKRVQKLLDDLYRSTGGAELDDNQKQLAVQLNEQITAMRAGQQARTKEFLELEKAHADIMKQLKATRDQRLKRIENIKASFTDIVKELMREEVRDREGESAELMALAGEKERDRLMQPHTYVDGQADRPFLNAESVVMDDEAAAAPPQEDKQE